MSAWASMDERPRRAVATLEAGDVPVDPGVYALYQDGEAVYVGKATSLRARLWRNHLRRGASMTNSALRRNVAEHLGVASSADIKARRYLTTPEDAQRVSEWIRGSEVAWMMCENEPEAVTLEQELKAEWTPPLTKI